MSRELKAKIALLPGKPGIYIFKNAKGEIIYVGKARSLKDRVRAYFQPTSDPKVMNIISETADLDFILTGSEKEAAFLENNFVQRYQPKFNLRLKDDKSFPYLKMTVAEKFPAILLTRKVEPDGSRYFGPFSPASQARRTIHLLNKYFGIRGCDEKVPGSRQRACLEYDLKLCAAPCVGAIGVKEYGENVADGLLFLEGKTAKLLKSLKQKMAGAAAELDYEQAAHWRDLVRTLEQIKERPKLISISQENTDIFGLAREKEKIAVYVFRMRRGKVREAEEAFLQEEEGISESGLISRVIRDFYRPGKEIPEKILLPFQALQEKELAGRLAAQRGARVKILVPQRGENRKLVEMANRNAEVLIKKKGEEKPSLQELSKILGLKTPPRRIEGFDISNTGGDESVGSLVVFEKGQPNKDEYRKYKIKTVSGPNDVASLQEVILRRYARVLEENRPLPDLILVDGGKGQLHAAEEILASLGLESLPLVSLAKREEILYVRGAKEGFRLDRTSPALKLLQFIRDEAHRFAVSFHRQRRTKKSFASRPQVGQSPQGAKK